jgi:hypothetical protein
MCTEATYPSIVCMIAAASNRTAGILVAAGAAMMLAGRRKNAMRAIYISD